MLDARIMLKRDTTAHWNSARGFIPLKGEVIIYDDYTTKEITKVDPITGETITKNVNIPNIKIGDGLAYVQDLPFIDKDLRDKLMEHINNYDIHVTLQDKAFWNNKVNIDDSEEIVSGDLVDDTLIFNRL